MKFKKTDLPDLYLIEPIIMKDNRGLFTKTFNTSIFEKNNLDFTIQESYYSISDKNVIRGMHFQTPPYEHQKIVYVTKGKVLDVVIDLRKNSPGFKKCFSTLLSEENRNILYIPVGFAHGFKSLENESCVVYCQSTVYSPQDDCGIYYDSINFNWNNSSDIIVSDRDKKFVNLKEFNSPFIYKK